MIPERKALWIEALRSGEYEQTNEFLSDGECFCALGVGADVAIKNGAPAFWQDVESYGEINMQLTDKEDESSASTLSFTKSVVQWYFGSGEYSSAARMCFKIADLNDFGADFPMIADVLENL